jgi:hypothetical protein
MKTVAPLVVSVALAAAGDMAADVNPRAERTAFGMVGLARTQTAVLNVVLSPVPEDGSPPPDDDRSCRVVLSFVGASGEPFHDAAGNEIKKMVTLRRQVAGSLTLRSQDVLTGTQVRAPIRAVLTPVPNDGAPAACRRLVATLEIVGPLGATQLLYTPPPDDNQPPPDDNLRRPDHGVR